MERAIEGRFADESPRRRMEVRPYDDASRLDFTLAEGPLQAVLTHSNDGATVANGRYRPSAKTSDQENVFGFTAAVAPAIVHIKPSMSGGSQFGLSQPQNCGTKRNR
ncbi:MAG: hypothetical protein GZ089_03315 [Aromatoleum sp.]|nr:hypothetical protein [Aromatoleum sp.]